MRHDHFPRTDPARCQRMRDAAAALAADWHAADTAPGGLLAAMEAAADAPPAIALARLAPWLADTRWLGARLSAALALLAADPFARPPLGLVGGGEGAGGLIVAAVGAIRLSLQLRPFDVAAAAPATALFVPGHARVRVLAAGGAALYMHHVAVSAVEEAGGFTASAAPRCLSAPPRPLIAGETLCLDTARTAFTLAGGSGDVLLLELAVQPPARLPIRAYDIATGRLIHVAAARRDASFRTMALALLAAMRRTDAAPLFVAEAASDDFAARWNAARELVALTPAAAAPVLERLAAADPHPEVRRAAAATLALYPPPTDVPRPQEAPCPSP